MTMTDFVNDPDSPFALVSAKTGNLLHTTGTLKMAEHIARKMTRGEWDDVTRQDEVLIHQHNGEYGWQAGTAIVATIRR